MTASLRPSGEWVSLASIGIATVCRGFACVTENHCIVQNRQKTGKLSEGFEQLQKSLVPQIRGLEK